MENVFYTMHKKFDHVAIEKKWQNEWQASGIYTAGERDDSKEKEYVLVELPYPSGNLHIGHWFAFAVVDIFVRAHRMQGKQVIFPIGFDAFGLPAENAAIKNNLDPKAWTEKNIEHMKKQLESMGNAFSWDLSCTSSDPDYYKWTQWMFTQFFEKDIAYRGTGTVNWCPSCNTVLANEQVINDHCERCGSSVEKKEMEEWKLRITSFADALIDDLDALNWPEHIKEAQRQWIGRSRGAKLAFKLSTKDILEVFTTRPDTLYGATYMVLAPEHDLVEKHKEQIKNWDEVAVYIKESKQKTEIERTKEEREKTGVKLDGITATNPATNEEIPVYIADYVLKGYGTGAIMAVPAHDARDYAFARAHNLPIVEVIEPVFIQQTGADAFRKDEEVVERNAITALVRDPKNNKYLGLKWKTVDWETLITGGIEDNQTAEEAARQEILEETGYKNLKLVKVLPRYHSKFFHRPKGVNRYAHFDCFLFDLIDDERVAVSQEEKDIHEAVWLTDSEMKTFKLPEGHRYVYDQACDACDVYSGEGILTQSDTFNGMSSEDAKTALTEAVGGEMTNTYRLRDWSVGRQRYWGTPIPIVYDPEGIPHSIPQEHLPWLLPTDVDFKPTGEPPLKKSKELHERTEKIFGKGWTPEVETMDTFVDSSWYFLRYIDVKNDSTFSSKEAQGTWMPVDMYFGGAEHTTMHLLYSRFWQKALHSLGLAVHSEPYVRRLNRGLVLGPDGNKMSKSKGNVVDPDEQVNRLGADTVKMYLAFMGPYGEASNYPWDMGGIAGQRRFLERVFGLSEHIIESESEEVTKQLHKTIQKVTSDIDLYKFNTAISALMIFVNLAEAHGLTKTSYQLFLRLLAPFAPHLTEELWSQQGHSKSVHLEMWPVADEKFLVEEEATIGVQINGKMRGSITLSAQAGEEEALTCVRTDHNLSKRLEGTIEKIIYKPGRILNIIIKDV